MAGGGSAPKPDKNIGIAARENAATAKEMLGISRETLDFSRQQYADQMAELERLRPTFDALAAGQVTATQLANEITQQARDDYNTTYRPIEQRVAADSMAAGSEAEQEQAAGRAGIDVQRSLDIQRGAADRSMMSMGVNPNSGKFAAGNRTAMILGAAARAGAETGGRERERLRGDMMRSATAAMGKGMTGTALTGIQVGGNAAAQAAGLTGTGLNTAGNIGQTHVGNMGAASSMMGNAANVNAGSANILNDLYASRMQGYTAGSAGAAGMYGALGQMGGAALGAFMSDKTKKTGKRKASGRKAREAIDAMPVEKWRYKPGTPYTDAEDGAGAEHIGPYAQDFAEKTGVGDGRTINVIDAIGVNMAATKELSRQVKALGREVRGAAA